MINVWSVCEGVWAHAHDLTQTLRWLCPRGNVIQGELTLDKQIKTSVMVEVLKLTLLPEIFSEAFLPHQPTLRQRRREQNSHTKNQLVAAVDVSMLQSNAGPGDPLCGPHRPLQGVVVHGCCTRQWCSCSTCLNHTMFYTNLPCLSGRFLIFPRSFVFLLPPPCCCRLSRLGQSKKTTKFIKVIWSLRSTCVQLDLWCSLDLEHVYLWVSFLCSPELRTDAWFCWSREVLDPLLWAELDLRVDLGPLFLF